MDRKGRWLNQVVIKQIRRSLQDEEVYLKTYASVEEAKESIREWMNF